MKFVVLGKYSTQGLAGFVKNPSDNRQEAAKKITKQGRWWKAFKMDDCKRCLRFYSYY